MDEEIDYFSFLPPSDVLTLSEKVQSSVSKVTTHLPTDFIFGYGSIINNTSRVATLSAACNHSLSETDGKSSTSAAAAVISTRFGYQRSWCYRASTGFTALGLELRPSTVNSPANALNDITDSGMDGICGILMPVANSNVLASFDLREIGYHRVEVPRDMITIIPTLGSKEDKHFASTLSTVLSSKKIWVYIPEPGRMQAPDEDYPILQTYVDVCLKGCLYWGGIDFAKLFLLTTVGWSEFYLNDAPLSRRPWLHRPDYLTIDSCLQELQSHVKFHERRHPEEFSSHHLTKLVGMWNVPTRNATFVGRQQHLKAVYDKLMGISYEKQLPSSHSSSISKVQIVGTGFFCVILNYQLLLINSIHFV